MKEMDAELIQLLGKYRDEEITQAELEKLERRLSSSSEERTFYLRFMQLDALLEKFPPISDEAPSNGSIHGGRIIELPARKAMIWLAAAAAVVVLATTILQSFLLNSDSRKMEVTGDRGIATLIFAEECQWEGPDLAEGQRLASGLVELTEGTAAVRFDGGAEAVLKGPASFRIDSPMAATLIFGEMVVRAENGAEGFTLETPSGPLIDLGTEFAVKVEDSGETELHVHEGEVALGTNYRENPGGIIKAGNAIRLEVSGEKEGQEINRTAPRFRELLERANPGERRDLMTVYEGFHFDPGVYSPKELTGGHGWKGPWRQRQKFEMKNHLPDSSDKLTIAMSQMDVSWPIQGGQMGMLELPKGPSIWIRPVKKPVKMGKWGIRYFSFLVTEPAVTELKKVNGRLERQDFRFTFRSSEDYFGESLSVGWESSLRPRLATESGPVRSIRTIPEGQTVFCVAKIETRKTSRDRISFRFYTRDEVLDFVEPAEWDVTLTDLRQSADFDLLVLTSNSPRPRYVDEIRMGPSWRSVTPIDLSRLMISSAKTR